MLATLHDIEIIDLEEAPEGLGLLFVCPAMASLLARPASARSSGRSLNRNHESRGWAATSISAKARSAALTASTLWRSAASSEMASCSASRVCASAQLSLIFSASFARRMRSLSIVAGSSKAS